MIQRASHIDNPMWRPKRFGRIYESFPIVAACRRKHLCASRATILVSGPSSILAVGAFHHCAGGVSTVQRHPCAFTSFWAASSRSQRNFLETCALRRYLPKCQSWEFCKFSASVRACGRVQLTDCALDEGRDLGVLNVQVFCLVGSLLA